MFGRHVTERRLAAIAAGEPETPHVSQCALCQARLAELRGWLDSTAGDAAAIADAVFTPERLAAQKQSVLARLEAAGRSARVIAFPIGTAAPATSRTMVVRWVTVAAAAGIVIGLASGRLLDPHTAAPDPVQAADRAATPATPVATQEPEDVEEAAALLDAAYDRVSLGALQTIDDMTPRARDIVLARGPRARR